MTEFLQIVQNASALVGLSAFLVTFVASVMADEQNERLRQGSFGAIAGTAVGGLAAVMEQKPDLLLLGVFGSACGAIVGWIVYLALSLLASFRWCRRLIEYHVSGLKGVREQIGLAERELLLSALTTWSQSFRGMVLRETTYILQNDQSAEYNTWVTVAIRAWLISLVDAFNLVLDALAQKAEYRSRITVIVFGRQADQETVGRHWISYSGQRQSHTRRDFTPASIAYQVLSGQTNSPCLTSMATANKEAQDRGRQSYSSFLVFRLNDHAVLSLDWPGKIEEHDPYVDTAITLLQLDVAPAVGQLLDRWPTPLSTEVQLEPLAEKSLVPVSASLSAVDGSGRASSTDFKDSAA